MIGQSEFDVALGGWQLFSLAIATIVVLTGGWYAARKNLLAGANEAAATWEGEVKALKTKLERVESDWRTERDQLQGELRSAQDESKRLQGRVDELSTVNAELRALVMGEKVPTAMADALGTVVSEIMREVGVAANRNLQAYLGVLTSAENEYFIPTQEVLNRIADHASTIPLLHETLDRLVDEHERPAS